MSAPPKGIISAIVSLGYIVEYGRVPGGGFEMLAQKGDEKHVVRIDRDDPDAQTLCANRLAIAVGFEAE